MTKGNAPTFDLKDYEGVKTAFTWEPSYTAIFHILPNDGERLNFVNAMLAMGTAGQIPENASESLGGKLALAHGSSIMDSHETRLAWARAFKKKER